MLHQKRQQPVALGTPGEPAIYLASDRHEAGTRSRNGDFADDLMHRAMLGRSRLQGQGLSMEFDPKLDWRIVDDGGYNTHNGPVRFASPGGGRWLGALELQAKHMNFGGVCHGGVYMSLVDVTMGIAAHEAAEGERCATIDLNAHFLAAAKLGQTLVAEARLNRRVSGVTFMECELWAGGRKCFRANGIWKALNLPRRTPA